MQTSRRHFLKGIIAAGVLGFSGSAYARFVEPRWLRLKEWQVPLGLNQPAQPIRLLHLSDLHLSQEVSLGHIEEAIAMGLETNPHCICLTGDYISHRLSPFEEYRKTLSRLAEKAPTFAVCGNHDGGAWAKARGGYKDSSHIRNLLTKCGIQSLFNLGATVDIAGTTLQFVGLGDSWADECQPTQAFSSVDDTPGNNRIVLSHNPDTKDQLKPFAWDLLLSGHTHGGQVALPFLGTPFAPVEDHRYVDGLYRWDDRYLHITRGVGNVGGLRFNCRPEVSLLHLV